MKADDEIVAAMIKTRPKMVGFRLDDDHRLILFRRAHLLKMSANELARLYLIERLHDMDERQEIRNAIMALGHELVETRKDFAVLTQELLVSAGKANITQARGWVKENLVAK